jgi:hypothetical protein
VIRAYSTFTTEIDEVEEALDELLDRPFFDRLSTNSVGILYTHYDFVDTGVVHALCERLPFDVVGMTAMANQSEHGYGRYRLGLTVLTGDDVAFSTAATPSLTAENLNGEIGAAYARARAPLPEEPKFIIGFFPYLDDVSGADVLDSFDALAGGLPIWGNVSSDMDMSYKHCRTIRNGVADRCSLAMILVQGDVEPEFIVTNITKNGIRESRAVITDSEGCLLRAINDVPVRDYMSGVGIELHSGSATTVPLLVNYGDGSPSAALAIYALNDDGSILTGGRVPRGATVAIGEIDREDIMETAGAALDRVMGAGKKDALLMASCVTRYFMLAPDQSGEMAYVERSIAGKLPFSFACAGGEICPVRAGDGRYCNRYHNYSFSACVL